MKCAVLFYAFGLNGLFLHLFGHPEHPRINVARQLFGIGQGNDDIGAVAGIPFLARLFKGVIHRHGIGQVDIAVGEEDVVAVS